MRLLQRYILFELLRVFAFVLSVLTCILVFVGVFREVSERGLGPLQILQILPFVVPSLLPFTIPATLLLTVCVVYGRIAGDQEITAAKAAGINVLALLWPSLLGSAVLSVCSLALTDQVIPWAVTNIQQKITLAMEDIFLDRLRTQYEISDPDRGLVISVMGVEGRRLIRPTFRYAPPGRRPVTVQAAEATLRFDLVNQQVLAHLIHGHIDTPGQTKFYFNEENKPFPMPMELEQPKPRYLSIRDIQRELKAIDRRLEALEDRRDIEAAMALTLGEFHQFQGREFTRVRLDIEGNRNRYVKLRTELHSRFALSFSCFFFVLLGSPFAILQARRQFLTSFLMCFLPILLVYYPVVMLMMNLCKTETVSPVWAMWVGNAILLAAGLAMLRKVMQH